MMIKDITLEAFEEVLHFYVDNYHEMIADGAIHLEGDTYFFADKDDPFREAPRTRIEVLHYVIANNVLKQLRKGHNIVRKRA